MIFAKILESRHTMHIRQDEGITLIIRFVVSTMSNSAAGTRRHLAGRLYMDNAKEIQ